MTNFAARVSEAVAKATPAASAKGERFREVFKELAQGLCSKHIEASIVWRKDPRRGTLVVYPKFRPGDRHFLLDFFVDGDEVRLSEGPELPFDSVEELEKRLILFVQSEAFIETKADLEERATLPVEARLRVDPQRIAKGDVLVIVQPKDQEMLAARESGHEQRVTTQRMKFPGNAPFSSKASYRMLESAGVLVDVEEASYEAEGIKLKVRAR